MSNNKLSFEKIVSDLNVKKIIAITVAVVLVGLYFINFHGVVSVDHANWGAFGDFIGGTLNPILAFLSFMALITTINIQLKQMSQTEEELQLTRDELKLTRTELERSATAQQDSARILEQQLKAQKIQQFENTFFSMLNQHNLLMNDLIHVPSSINDIETDFRKLINRVFWSSTLTEAKHNLLLSVKAGQYFRVLFQLLKLIHSVSYLENKKTYSALVRSFLNNDILQLLAINCYCQNGKLDSFALYKKIVEDFSLLEHMSMSLSDGERRNQLFVELINHYEKEAFGKSDYLSFLAKKIYSGVSLSNDGDISAYDNGVLIKANLSVLHGDWSFPGNTLIVLLSMDKITFGESGTSIQFSSSLNDKVINFDLIDTLNSKENVCYSTSGDSEFGLELSCLMDGSISLSITNAKRTARKDYFLIPADELTLSNISFKDIYGRSSKLVKLQ